MLRSLALVMFALFLCAADDPPPVPEPLNPYVRDGRLEAGDYGWLRGAFPGAAAEDHNVFLELNAWTTSCFNAAREKLRVRLVALGFPNPEIDNLPVAPLLCRQLASNWVLAGSGSFAEFERALERARPVADAFLIATDLAQQHGGPRGSGLGDALAARPLSEQMLRLGAFWGTGAMANAPALPPVEKAIVIARISTALAARDYDNSAWMKKLLAGRGWPTISEVGEAGALSAWLLVQHADADPEFQLEALRKMEPLVAAGEVQRSNHALLYDRVMLKLAGKQRYATQMQCIDGNWAPRALEDEAAVARLRSEAGLPPMAEYLALLTRNFGKCQPMPMPSPRSPRP